MRICAAVVVVAALTSACANAAPAPSPPPTTAGPHTLAELDRRAKAALALPESFVSLAGEMDQSAAELDDLPMAVEGQAIGEVCGALLRVGKGTSAARKRTWSGGIHLFERVHVTSEMPAAELVSNVRQRVRECGRPAGEVLGDVALSKPAGVDESYAYCEANDPGVIGWSCQAALGQGNVFAFVTVGGMTVETATAQLTKVTPIFAMNLTLA